MLLRRNPEESNLIRYIKEDDINSFQLLVDSIINVNFKFSTYSPYLDEYLRFSPSLLAVSAYYKAIRIFRYLLISGADLTVKDKRNISIAHFAVYGGDFEILHLLDEHGVPFDGTLFTAAERGSEDVFKWILYYQSEDLHQRRKDGTSLVDASSKGGNWKLTSFILDSIKDDLSISEAFRLLQLIRESKYDQSDESEDYDESNNSDDDNEKDNDENNNNVTKYNEYSYSYSENDDSNVDETTNEESSIFKNSKSDSDNYEETENEENDSENENSETQNESENDDINNENKGQTDKNDNEIIKRNMYSTENESSDSECKNTENESSDNGSENTDSKKENDDSISKKYDDNTDVDEESASTDAESHI